MGNIEPDGSGPGSLEGGFLRKVMTHYARVCRIQPAEQPTLPHSTDIQSECLQWAMVHLKEKLSTVALHVWVMCNTATVQGLQNQAIHMPQVLQWT